MFEDKQSEKFAGSVGALAFAAANVKNECCVDAAALVVDGSLLCFNE